MANNLNTSAIINGFSASLNYDYNEMNDFLNDDELIDSHPFKRYSSGYFLSIGSSIGGNFSANLTIPYVVHFRSVNDQNPLNSSGFSDPVVILNYQLGANTKNSFSFGVGLGVPLGENKEKDNTFGFLLPFDMQPALRTWTFYVTSRYQRQSFISDNMYFFTNLIYQNQVPTKRPGSGQQFKLGAEYQNYSGFGYNFFLFSAMISPQIALRVKYTDFDMVNTIEVNNSGGFWVFNSALLQFQYKKFTSFVGMEVPIYRVTNGSQLTTSLRLRGGFGLFLSYK